MINKQRQSLFLIGLTVGITLLLSLLLLKWVLIVGIPALWAVLRYTRYKDNIPAWRQFMFLTAPILLLLLVPRAFGYWAIALSIILIVVGLYIAEQQT